MFMAQNTPHTTWLRLREYLWSDPAMTIHHVVLPLLILPMISVSNNVQLHTSIAALKGM